MHVPWNPANLLSFGRLVATLPLVVLILLATPWSLFAAAVLFVVMAITETVDGRLAREFVEVETVAAIHTPQVAQCTSIEVDEDAESGRDDRRDGPAALAR